ncbi:MAG: hypothetical protein M3P06_12020 [Acidobacteriota bacterium]|nr:hypothetical protein [Acidobacteriota bacterium]
MDSLAAGLGIVAAILIVEIVLSSRWSHFYFTVGLPIFWRRVDRVIGLENQSLNELLQVAATVAGTPLLFRRLGPDIIAFREKAFGGSIHYMPIMHGVIRRRVEESTAVVVGLANWYIVALIAMFAILLGDDFLAVVPYFLAAVGIVYLIQSMRYARVARALRRVTANQEGP